MQVAIVGSRDSRELTVDDLIQMIPLNCTRLISGGAEGVDQLARQAAENLGIPLTEYLPDYETYGRLRWSGTARSSQRPIWCWPSGT